ncbi:hypothetical protein PV04_06807 [Phialophora macrospora]|uniref:Uncharacterized protein n=1 Tax=Phialophora macrospora TaxID=1851006 RepID=A0A0D2DZL2_9EURO|nr:hypothetical protein PV04_06807 [Phialophora macrospora]
MPLPQSRGFDRKRRVHTRISCTSSPLNSADSAQVGRDLGAGIYMPETQPRHHHHRRRRRRHPQQAWPFVVHPKPQPVSCPSSATMSTSHSSTSTRETPIEPKTVDTTAAWDTRRLDQKDTSQALLEYTAYLGRCIAGADIKPTTSPLGSERK